MLERVGEIGLRRAVGATRRDIGAQLMVESVVIGLLAGLYPSLKAASIEPIAALRGGV